ncbi:MAG: universal stress protein [Halodesulfurarchaeum sp.]
MSEEELPEGVVGTANAVAPTESDGPTIMVPVLNPRTEGALITLASILAKHQGGRVLATHIITVPDQTSLQAAAQNRDRIDSTSQQLLEKAVAEAEEFDVPIETRTILSHRGLSEVFEAARTNDVDTVVMGYGGARFAGGRAEGPLDELTHDLPCDFLVLDGTEIDPGEVLIPTRGSRSSELSAEVAQAMMETVDAEVSLLHVVDPGMEESGRSFLEDWAADNGLSEAAYLVEPGSPVSVIREVSSEYDLIMLGATERGLLSRVVRGSATLAAFEELDVPLLLAERPSARSIWERLFRSG